MLQDASVYRIFKGRKHSFRDRYTTKSKLYSISAINSQNYITANQSLRIVPKSVTFSALRFIPTDFNYSQFLATRRESDSKTPSKEVKSVGLRAPTALTVCSHQQPLCSSENYLGKKSDASIITTS